MEKEEVSDLMVIFYFLVFGLVVIFGIITAAKVLI